MQAVVPAIPVRSYIHSLAFYTRLGFQEAWRRPAGLEGAALGALFWRGRVVILEERGGVEARAGLVLFYVPDVEDCWSEFRAAGLSDLAEPEEGAAPGVRNLRLVDPDGNRLWFLSGARPAHPA